MEIAYTAHTEACTYLLDTEGICRSVLAASSGPEARGGPVRIPVAAERCIGAQYVASLDLRQPGGMIAAPTPGAQLLFARTEKNGRITLVRTAPLLRFETAGMGARVESGVHARPSAPSYGDEEMTTPFSGPTLPFRREALAPIARATSGTERVAQAFVFTQEPPVRVTPVPMPMPPRASVAPPTWRSPSQPPPLPQRPSTPIPAVLQRPSTPAPPQHRSSPLPPRPMPPAPMRGSSVPPAPMRSSGVVPASQAYAARATIPPPAPAMRMPRASYAPPPSYPPPSHRAPYLADPYLDEDPPTESDEIPIELAQPVALPKRPSVVRVSAPFWEAAMREAQPKRTSAR